MASYNKVVLIGNLTRDPEYKQLGSGQAVCRLGLAVNRQFKNRQTGSLTQEVCYIDIDVWGAQAENCKQYLSKGRPVLIEGRLKYDSWKDEQNGQMRSKHSISADLVQFLPVANAGSVDAGTGVENDFGTDKKGAPARSGSFGADLDQVNMGGKAQFALEKELLGQIEQIKERAAKNGSRAPEKKMKKDEGFDGEGASFQDEPPFDDELPF